MPRKHRLDFPGAWHHVMNRGVSRRTLYESEDDARSWSFIQAFKILRKRSAHTFVDATIDDLIKNFRDLIRPIRDHRDSYIVHHSKQDRAHLKPPQLLTAI